MVNRGASRFAVRCSWVLSECFARECALQQQMEDASLRPFPRHLSSDILTTFVKMLLTTISGYLLVTVHQTT